MEMEKRDETDPLHHDDANMKWRKSRKMSQEEAPWFRFTGGRGI
jgi:hypothetical protein